MSSLMPTNTKAIRISTQNKLATRPEWLDTSKLTRETFRVIVYSYNTLQHKLTTQPDIYKFKKEVKKYLLAINV